MPSEWKTLAAIVATTMAALGALHGIYLFSRGHDAADRLIFAAFFAAVALVLWVIALRHRETDAE